MADPLDPPIPPFNLNDEVKRTITPNDDILILKIEYAESVCGGTGVGLKKIKEEVERLEPEWVVSTKRVRELRKQAESRKEQMQQQQDENNNLDVGGKHRTIETEGTAAEVEPDESGVTKAIKKRKEETEDGHTSTKRKGKKKPLTTSAEAENTAHVSYGTTYWRNGNITEPVHLNEEYYETRWLERRLQTLRNDGDNVEGNGEGPWGRMEPCLTEEEYKLAVADILGREEATRQKRRAARKSKSSVEEVLGTKDTTSGEQVNDNTAPTCFSTPRGHRIIRPEPVSPGDKAEYKPDQVQQETQPSLATKADDGRADLSEEKLAEIETNVPANKSNKTEESNRGDLAPATQEPLAEEDPFPMPTYTFGHEVDQQTREKILAISQTRHFFNDLRASCFGNDCHAWEIPTGFKYYTEENRNDRLPRRATFSEGDQQTAEQYEMRRWEGFGSSSERFVPEKIVLPAAVVEEQTAQSRSKTEGRTDMDIHDVTTQESEVLVKEEVPTMARMFEGEVQTMTNMSFVKVYVDAICNFFSFISTHGSAILQKIDRRMMNTIFTIEKALDDATVLIVSEIEGSYSALEEIYDDDANDNDNKSDMSDDEENEKESGFQNTISLVVIMGMAILISTILGGFIYWYAWKTFRNGTMPFIVKTIRSRL